MSNWFEICTQLSSGSALCIIGDNMNFLLNEGRLMLERETYLCSCGVIQRTYSPGASGNNSGKNIRSVSATTAKGKAMSSSEQSNVVVVQNFNSSAQQDDLILSMIEQLKPQVVHCTKMNLENKSVNDTLTAELERYKEQVKVLKEGQNINLKSQDNISDSCAQSVEIDHLKRTLSEHLKENESLLQMVTLLKNDFKKEESRNLNRDKPLDKSVQTPSNIRDNSISKQSAPSFDQLFELNELKAQSQEKYMVIKKLKERVKFLNGNIDKDKIKQDLEEIETINIELDHRVSKVIA
ncbi:hypothetical protein Tco_0383300 [Tanacetum coccineum]